MARSHFRGSDSATKERECPPGEGTSGGGHLGPGRVHAGGQQVGVGEGAEDGHGFGVACIQVGAHPVQARGQVSPVARVGAGAALHVFRDHEALQPREMAEQVAEGEGPRRWRPLQILGPQRRPHPHRAGPGVAPVGEEGGGVLEHGLIYNRYIN